ncbi:MAG TPA: nicotinate-nucleotide adenylyltransferase [Spongiibacteraceae bacterium]
MLNSLAVMGGTFDPIHIGHLRSALEMRELLGCEQLRFIPCLQSPHRATPTVSGALRLRMIELAIVDESDFAVDARELDRSGPSYTIDTLSELRAELGAHCTLYLIIGMDAFAELDTWRRWRELLDFAHIVVMQRPQSEVPRHGAVARLLQEHQRDVSELKKTAHGGIAVVTLTPLPISATAIRTLISGKRSPRYLLPDAVWAFIREQHLYV